MAVTTDFDTWWADNHDSHGDCYETARDAWNEQRETIDRLTRELAEARAEYERYRETVRGAVAERDELRTQLATMTDIAQRRQVVIDACREREGRLREALKWALAQIPEPQQRLAQNADYFDAYQAARTALAEGKGEGHE